MHKLDQHLKSLNKRQRSFLRKKLLQYGLKREWLLVQICQKHKLLLSEVLALSISDFSHKYCSLKINKVLICKNGTIERHRLPFFYRRVLKLSPKLSKKIQEISPADSGCSVELLFASNGSSYLALKPLELLIFDALKRSSLNSFPYEAAA